MSAACRADAGDEVAEQEEPQIARLAKRRDIDHEAHEAREYHTAARRVSPFSDGHGAPRRRCSAHRR
jgi:hypothetical protein